MSSKRETIRSFKYSGFFQPHGKFWKRQASKKLRKNKEDRPSKKLYGWFSWN